MDGAKQWAQSPVVIATTTRPNSIDPALRRPGRFDREIETSLPNANERSLILKLHLRNVPLDDNGNNLDYERDIETIAKNSKGYSGADLQSLCREAVTVAVKRSAMNAQIDNENNNDVKVRPSDFVEAASKVRATVIRNVASVTDVAKTSWNDVGGLFEVKKRLVRAIEWPLKKKNSFERLEFGQRGVFYCTGHPAVGKRRWREQRPPLPVRPCSRFPPRMFFRCIWAKVRKYSRMRFEGSKSVSCGTYSRRN